VLAAALGVGFGTMGIGFYSLGLFVKPLQAGWLEPGGRFGCGHVSALGHLSVGAIGRAVG
jgi:hypothetical protein